MVSQPSCNDRVEGKERRISRHKHFGRMAEMFGYSSRYEFALHVRDAGREERQRLLRDRVRSMVGLRGRGRRLQRHHQPRGFGNCPSLSQESQAEEKENLLWSFKTPLLPPPPLLQDTSESHDTEEKFPEGMESLEVRADASLTSPVLSRLQSATTSDHNNIHNNHVHEEVFTINVWHTF